MRSSSQQVARMRRRDQRGIALILCLFALILLSSIALALVYMADTETIINRNFRWSQQAYFAANAGLEEARSRLTPDLVPWPGGPGIATPTLLPGAGPTSVVYIIDRKVVNGTLETVDPLYSSIDNPYYDTELCHENHPLLPMPNTGFNAPCDATAPTGAGWWTYVDSTDPGTKTTKALDFKWVRINLKTNATNAHGGAPLSAGSGFYVDGFTSSNYNTPVCWDGVRQLLKPDSYTACDVPGPGVTGAVIYKPVVMLTAFGQGSRRITQMEVAQNPPIVTNAAVDSKDYVSLTGNLGVNGYDYCSCQEKRDASGNIVYDANNHPIYESRTDKICDASKWAIYSTQDIVASGAASQNIVAGPNPPTLPNQTNWPYDIPKLVQDFVASPNVVDVTKSPAYAWTCTPPTPPDTSANCGTQSGAILGVPPNFPPSPVDNPIGPTNMAQQITYVPGNVALHGNAVGNGVLVVNGDLEVDGGLQFYGLILVSGVVKFKGGGSQDTNIYGAVLAGERSIDNTTMGGSANIQYDYCSLTRKLPPQPPTMISFRELTY